MFFMGKECLAVIFLSFMCKTGLCGIFILPPFFIPSVPLQPNRNYGSPLFLTSFIQSGKIEEARNLSLVGPLPNAPVNLTSYSGLLTVNETYGSNLFFWYFPAIERDPANAQTMVWLQGGPGWSSLYGVFMESGPYIIYDNDKVKMRNSTWSKMFNVIYIDNPVGTGFSFTENTDGYARNDHDVADNLYSAIIQLFQLFPEFQNNDFYVAGESWGGKFATMLSAKLRESKPPSINFVGLFMGNPLLDLNIVEWGNTLYDLGLVNYQQRLHFDSVLDRSRILYSQQRYEEAGALLIPLYTGSGSYPDISGPSYFNNVTCYETNTNMIYTSDPALNETYTRYLAVPAVRRALHVGNYPYLNGSIVIDYYNDIKSVANVLGTLINDYKTMLYYGGLDMLLTYRASERIIRDYMPTWSGSSKYRAADRVFWRLNPEDRHLAGYVTSVERFRHVMVRGGGHLAPFAQPERVYDMIRRFILDMSFQS